MHVFDRNKYNNVLCRVIDKKDTNYQLACVYISTYQTRFYIYDSTLSK